MAAKHLVVFVHGWGANRDDWWGSTKTAFESERKLKDKVRFYFHGYDTYQSPDIRLWGRVREIFGSKSRVQELGQLGEHLWSVLRQEFEGATSVALFGHSFGGLVVADAVRYGAEQ